MSNERQELFEGYRPLITHNRKRNTIPAEMPKSVHRWPGQDGNQHENPPARYTLRRHPPSPFRERALAGHDKAAAIFKAKIEALIERYKPVEARRQLPGCKHGHSTNNTAY